MNQQNNFYLSVAMALIIMNFLAVGFMGMMIVLLAIIQYGGLPLQSIGEDLTGGVGFWDTQLNSVFNLLLQIPQSLDYMYMAIVGILCIDLVYFSYKAKEEGWITFSFIMLLGLPIWGVIVIIINRIRDSIIVYLSAAIIDKPSTPFFDIFVNNVFTLSVALFFVCVFVNRFDWGNLRDRVFNNTKEEGESLEEVFRQ